MTMRKSVFVQDLIYHLLLLIVMKHVELQFLLALHVRVFESFELRRTHVG